MVSTDLEPDKEIAMRLMLIFFCVLTLCLGVPQAASAEQPHGHPGDCNYGPAGSADHSTCWLGILLWGPGLSPVCENDPVANDPQPIDVTVEQHGPAGDEKVIITAPCPPGQGWGGQGFVWDTLSRQQAQDGALVWGLPGGIASWRPNSPGSTKGTQTIQFCASTIQRHNVLPPSLPGSGN